MRKERHRVWPGLGKIEAREIQSRLASSAVLHIADVAIDGRRIQTSSEEWDRSRFAEERSRNSPRDYPFLGRDYEVLAPSTDRYNCVAFALGFRDRWINPQTGPARSPLLWADRTFGKQGYHRLPTLDMSLVPGEQKVALLGFTNRKGTVTAVKHATLQRLDGTWASKLGEDSLIRHPTPQSVAGPSYGKPIAIYERAI